MACGDQPAQPHQLGVEPGVGTKAGVHVCPGFSCGGLITLPGDAAQGLGNIGKV